MLLVSATAPHAEASEETIAEIVSLADPTGDRELSRFDEIGSAFEADDSGVATHVTAHESGVRLATIIEHEDASHEFAYDIEDADLTVRADGTIEAPQIGLIVNPDGTEHQEAGTIATVEAPWAVDAAGQHVETRYKLSATGFTQIIIPTADTPCPIVADPDWRKTFKCTAAIVWPLGSSMFAGAKVIKIKSYIKALGGTKSAVKLLMKATTAEERLRVGGTALKNLAAELLGVAAVRITCF